MPYAWWMQPSLHHPTPSNWGWGGCTSNGNQQQNCNQELQCHYNQYLRQYWYGVSLNQQLAQKSDRLEECTEELQNQTDECRNYNLLDDSSRKVSYPKDKLNRADSIKCIP